MEDVTKPPRKNLLEAREKKVDPIGYQIFGEEFKGFMRLAQIVDLIPAFKDFYYAAKIKNPDETLSKILQGFNKEVMIPMGGRRFFPSMSQLRVWRRKWDLDLMQQMQNKDLQIVERKNVHQVIKTRNSERALVLGMPQDEELEAGIRTLGGELTNDALQMLRDDQELEEVYDDETLIKRRNYIVNVFAHVTKLVHGKAALMLKASEEKRNTAGFLMSLLSRAAAGQMTDEEMHLLETAYVPKVEETQVNVSAESK